MVSRIKFKSGCLSVLFAIILFFNAYGFAAEPPDAGKTLQSIKDSEITLLPRKEADLIIKPGPKAAKEEAEGIKFIVNGFHITGQTAYSEAQLATLLRSSIGKEHTFSELQQAVDRITRYYQDNGFPVARAYLPVQDIIDGIVNIAIVEGKYGNIKIVNKARISDQVILSALEQVKAGQLIQLKQLERGMLMVNDIPGIEARAILSPGTTFGTSELTVEVFPVKTMTGSASADNHGNRFTGEIRGEISLDFNNIGGMGDQFSFSALTAGEGLVNGRMGYSLPVGGQGSRFGVEYLRLRYELGQEFASLNASGTANTMAIFEQFTLRRERSGNLYAQIKYEGKHLQDRIDSANITADKQSDTWTLTLFGNNRDGFGGGGYNSFSASVSIGRLDILMAEERDIDAASTRTNGSFTKGNFSVLRLQRLNSNGSLYLSFSGQLASKNLDSSEKFSLGGASSVRAYPPGEASGDAGWLFTCEYRWNIPGVKRPGDIQLVGFYDAGSVMINKSLWPGATGANHRHLAGAGVGIIISRTGDFNLRLDYAWKVGTEKAVSDNDKNGRLWLQATTWL